jgi:Amt family ammonium transporter
MQAGFMYLEMGSVSAKNLRNAMVKHYISICTSAIMFYLIGYGIAFG